MWVYLVTESGYTIDVRSTKESAEKEKERLKSIDKIGNFRVEAWEVEE